ncbi:MAG: response regulator [Candidatus Cloacimonetes bacterium]|nr:response regulator [Candidatus Cloacimonadota bacterium]
MKVLLIDDNEVLNCLLTKYLRKHGHKVENVFTGTEGVKRALSTRFDVIITDYRLPDISGVDILQLVKKINNTKIMISAYYTKNIIMQSLELGATVVEKPFSNKEILKLVNNQHDLAVGCN